MGAEGSRRTFLEPFSNRVERGLMVLKLESYKQRAGRQMKLPNVVVESTSMALLAN